MCSLAQEQHKGSRGEAACVIYRATSFVPLPFPMDPKAQWTRRVERSKRMPLPRMFVIDHDCRNPIAAITAEGLVPQAPQALGPTPVADDPGQGH